jgi:hypothetical protein
LVVTNQRVLFRPLDVGAAQKMIKEGVRFLPDELAVLGKVVNKVFDYTVAYGEGLAGGIETSKITGVRPGRNAGLLHPPTLVLSFGNGRTLEIGVLKSIGTPNISPANNLARNELVHGINQQLE